MKIIHRISISTTRAIQKELARLGVVAGEGLVTFEVDEADERWPGVSEWVVRRDAPDFVSTKFSAAETDDANWLEVVPTWHHGYPQPEDEYMAATYDLTDYCPECGIGAKQNAPFRMKSEPRWGRNGILQLNWVFGEYFTKPEIWDEIFKPHGIGCRHVLNAKERELKTVVQLVVEQEIDIVIADLTVDLCSSCGRVKYEPHVRGPFPRLLTQPKGHAAKTTAYFGSGGSAHKAVLVSQQLRGAFAAAKTRGAVFKPVAQDSV